MPINLVRSNRGFSLIETLIAAGIFVTSLASLAQLIGWSVNQTTEAGRRARSLAAAQDKLERLRVLAWTIDVHGSAISDAGLSPSPAGSLDANSSGFVEWLDETGQLAGQTSALVVRRWSVGRVDTSFPETLALEVCAFRAPAMGTTREGADACVSTVRVRQP